MLRLQLVDGNQHIKMTSFPLGIGSDEGNDFVISDVNISDFHAEINTDAAGLFLVELLSTGGTFINEQRVTGTQRLKAWDTIRMGSTCMEIWDPNSCRPGSWALRTSSDLLSNQFFMLKTKTLVGRDPDCDLTIDWDMLSRKHAELLIDDGHLKVKDLDSRNGTWINGKRITEAIAYPEDELRFDEQRFVVVGPVKASTTRAWDKNATQTHRRIASDTLFPETAEPIATAASLTSPSIKKNQGRHSLLPPKVYIGRSAENDLVIEDPGVSKSHALLEFTRGRWQISDLKSRNGILVNGVEVSKAFLSHGDTIVIGRSEITFENDPVIAMPDDTISFKFISPGR